MDHCSSHCCWSTFSTACLPVSHAAHGGEGRRCEVSPHTHSFRAGATRGKLQLCCFCHHHYPSLLLLLFYGADMRRSRRHNFHQCVYSAINRVVVVPSASTYTASSIFPAYQRNTLSLSHFQSQFCVHVLAQCSLYYSLSLSFYRSASLLADWKATSLSCCSQCGGVCSVQLLRQFDARQESECITITIAIINIISDCVFGVSFTPELRGTQNSPTSLMIALPPPLFFSPFSFLRQCCAFFLCSCR